MTEKTSHQATVGGCTFCLCDECAASLVEHTNVLVACTDTIEVGCDLCESRHTIVALNPEPEEGLE
jgi:hypothetical protein